MQASMIEEGQVPKFLNLIDATVRLYLDGKKAASGYNFHIRNQLKQLSTRFPQIKELADLLKKAQSNVYEVEAGSAYCLKWKYRTTKGIKIVCVSESAINLEPVFGGWIFQMENSPDPHLKSSVHNLQLRSLGTAPRNVQERFGKALGNVIAHEVRHLLKLTNNPLSQERAHADSGLGAWQPAFTDPNIVFSDSDQCQMLFSIQSLVKEQSDLTPQPIKRNAPY
jgi:hypothetical protein